MISKKALRKHWRVIEWWKDQPEWMGVWCKMPQGYPPNMTKWHLEREPLWILDAKYVINDTFAGLRKAIADGKTIEVYDEGEWKPMETVFTIVPADPNSTFFEDLAKHGWDVNNFRVKKDD